MQSIDHEDYGKVVDPGPVKFSPDGSQIAYMYNGYAYVLSADGKKRPLKLSKAESGYAKIQLLWSLDAKKLYLLFYSEDRRTYEIYAAAADNLSNWSEVAKVTAETWRLNLSVDHTHWLLSASEPPKSTSDEKAIECAPIVIDAMVFKRDGKGYVESDASDSIYSFDISAETAKQLTNEAGHDTEPAWSPDGKNVAFIREDLSKAEYRSDLCVVSSKGPSDVEPRVLTSSAAEKRSPAWSPNGKDIVYFWRDAKHGPYAVTQLAICSLETGREKILTKKHDRTITSFQFSHDGRFIYFLFDNEGGSHLARIRLSNSRIECLISGERYVNSFDLHEDGRIVLNMKNMNDGADIYIMKDGPPKRLTDINRRFFESKAIGSKEHFFYSPKNGPRIQALVTKPAGFDPSKKYPAVLRIHGGPVQQAKFGYDFFSQYLAANGYVVIEPNPPGSTGRGQDFISGVRSDWGFKKDPDVLGAIDEAVKLGYADENKLFVVGYSYGGYMTNCIITLAPKKFRAAASGAGHSFIAANYGHDIYLKWYNWGMGHPWISKDRRRYEKLSPLNDAEKVQTPTLFLCGAQDWNVPILNAELFYQALRVRGVPTRLIVYPKAAHNTNWDIGGCQNSKDYFKRIVDWLNHYLEDD